MRRSSSFLLAPSLFLLACADSAPAPAPASAPASASAAVLRERFREQAPLVLEQGDGFVRVGSSFVQKRATEARSFALDLTLPERADAPLHFQTNQDLAIEVREVGAFGEARLDNRAVAYARAGGTSFWTVSSDGFEEWIHLEKGASRNGVPALSWEVSGAPLAQDGPSVVILGSKGIPAMRVTAPVAFGKDGREVAARMVVSDKRIELFVDSNGEEVLIDPSWTVGTAMGTARRDHTATKLNNGNVLAVGGIVSSPSASVELWDAGTGTWTARAAMSVARAGHTASVLPNGRVFVVAGNSGAYQTSTAIYDSAANTWIAGPSLATARAYHTMTVLDTGEILIAGGTNSAVTSTVELVDASALGSFAPKASMNVPRQRHTATVLLDGRVLVAGGRDATTHQTYEIYNPTTNTWSTPKNMMAARDQHTAVRLADGRVVVAGGRNGAGAALNSVEIYDPATDTWGMLGTLATSRYGHTASLLTSGAIYLVAGYSTTFTNATEFTSLSSPLGIWSAGPALSVARNLHTATVLNDGRLLVTGGFNGASLSSVEILAPGGTGVACTSSVECASGFCADGVCCKTACNAGPCDACSVAAGAAADGTCSLLTGPVCNDKDACTQTDTCQAGVCVGMNPVVCTALDQCHDVGTCNSGTGKCSDPIKPDGSDCSDGNACTQTDLCKGGVCGGSNPVVCMALDECHDVGACDIDTGLCSNPIKLDGSKCSDNNFCTLTDACKAGVCVGENPIVCKALDQCHDVGMCDPATGKCSDPNKADGADCTDDDLCTQTDACMAGKCVGSNPVVCTALDVCHDAGTCLPMSGLCDHPVRPDGVPCEVGSPNICQAGACTLTCMTDNDCAQPEALCTGVGGVCSKDIDNDGKTNIEDNCPKIANPDQLDNEKDQLGDACDPDDDNDGIEDVDINGEPLDLCPLIPNPNQNGDADGDGVGFGCDCSTNGTALSDGTPCDDGSLCTGTGTCSNGACVESQAKVCPPVSECQIGICDPKTGNCVGAPVVDNTPCKTLVGGVQKQGLCFAGACLADDAGTGGSGGGGGSSSGNGGNGGSGGNGSGASGGSSGEGSTTTGAGGNGTTPSGTPILKGDGVSCAVGSGSPREAWLGLLGLLFFARRRRSVARR